MGSLKFHGFHEKSSTRKNVSFNVRLRWSGEFPLAIMFMSIISAKFLKAVKQFEHVDTVDAVYKLRVKI